MAGEIAIQSLAAEQEFQTMLDVLAVFALQVRLAVAEKREQRQAGDAGIGLSTGALAING